MKLLLLNSSYRKQGNTARALELLARHLQQAAAAQGIPLQLETLHLGHKNIQMCQGCRVCFNRGEGHCPLKDELLSIKARMDEVDGLVVASPVYVDDVNGIMKNFIDRLAFCCHRPQFGGKAVYLLTTVGQTRSSHALRTMDTAFRTWGFHVIGKRGLSMGALMPDEEIEQRFDPVCQQTAATILNAVQQQQHLKPSFVSLMIFKIQQIGWRRRLTDGSLDYAHWSGMGWLNPKTEFYYAHQASPLKVAAARLVGRLIAPFVV